MSKKILNIVIFVALGIIALVSFVALGFSLANRSQQNIPVDTSIKSARLTSESSVKVGDFVHVNTQGTLDVGFGIESWAPVSTSGVLTPLADSAYVQLGDKLYMFGGALSSLSSFNISSDIYEYDLETKVITILTTSGPSPFPYVTYNPFETLDAPNQDVYLYGGWDGAGGTIDDISNRLHRFNIPTNTFTLINATNNPGYRFGGTMNIYNRYLYLYGGFELGGIWKDDMYRLNLDNTTAWELVTPITSGPGPRMDYIWLPFGGTKSVFFAGSPSGGVQMNDLWTFDFSTHHWIQIYPNGVASSPPIRLGAVGVIVADRYLYMYSGSTGPTILGDYWVLDTNTWTWFPLSNEGATPVFRGYMGLVPSSQSPLIFGGFRGITHSATDASFQFSPASPPMGMVTSLTGAFKADVQSSGVVTNSDWYPLIPGLPVYIDTFGIVTQQPLQNSTYEVGVAVTADSILLK